MAAYHKLIGENIVSFSWAATGRLHIGSTAVAKPGAGGVSR